MTDERKIVHELRDCKEYVLAYESKAHEGIFFLKENIEFNKKRIGVLEPLVPEDAAGTFGIRIMALQTPKEMREALGLDDEITFRICNVYWTAKGDLKGYAEQTVIQGEDLNEVRENLQYCMDALTKPIYYGGDRWPEMHKSTTDGQVSDTTTEGQG